MSAGGLSAVHIIAGPTASGKSARAMERALESGGAIINADSVQLYDALPLLTAQPSEADKRKVPHRLYSVLKPGESCSARRWAEMAQEQIRQVRALGRQPILVGGTGFYLKALTEGFSPVPEIPEGVRAEAVALQNRLGNPAFHAHLASLDPVMGARLHPQDTQRLTRAWEVLTFTGRSLFEWQAQARVGMEEGLSFHCEIILPERADLYAACDRRFDAMMEAGALEEAAAFDAKIQNREFPDDCAPTKALGFQELQSYLRGFIALEEAVTRAKARTRHYAKRQVTWFRHQMAVTA